MSTNTLKKSVVLSDSVKTYIDGLDNDQKKAALDYLRGILKTEKAEKTPEEIRASIVKKSTAAKANMAAGLLTPAARALVSAIDKGEMPKNVEKLADTLAAFADVMEGDFRKAADLFAKTVATSEKVQKARYAYGVLNAVNSAFKKLAKDLAGADWRTISATDKALTEALVAAA